MHFRSYISFTAKAENDPRRYIIKGMLKFSFKDNIEKLLFLVFLKLCIDGRVSACIRQCGMIQSLKHKRRVFVLLPLIFEMLLFLCVLQR